MPRHHPRCLSPQLYLLTPAPHQGLPGSPPPLPTSQPGSWLLHTLRPHHPRTGASWPASWETSPGLGNPRGPLRPETECGRPPATPRREIPRLRAPAVCMRMDGSEPGQKRGPGRGIERTCRERNRTVGQTERGPRGGQRREIRRRQKTCGWISAKRASWRTSGAGRGWVGGGPWGAGPGGRS